MAWRTEKNGQDTDIVIDGFEKGIASSPHFGLANIQNANISTELGEVTASFVRTNQIFQGAISGGTLTASVSDGTTKLDAPSTLYGGQQIDITATTITVTEPPPDVTFSYLVAAGGGGGGGGASVAGGGGGAGEVLTGTITPAVASYAITVGTGGAGYNSTGPVVAANGTNSSIDATVVSLGGGHGGDITNNDGASGGSGGGGAGLNVATNPGVATGSGNDGGNSFTSAGAGNRGGGGGGGQSATGADATSATGGVGGDGVASTISGSSLTYGGGGGGGGGSTNAASGSCTSGYGKGGNGKYNTNGDAGAAGVVIISYTTGSITATGGTITTSGGNTIHTFTTSGTFQITAFPLPLGTYYISYKDSSNKVKLSYFYDPFCDHPIIHSTSGTATFDTVTTFANPISKATEKFSDGSSVYYRYYVLDSNYYVWVHDPLVSAYTLSNSGTEVDWVLPDPTDYSAIATFNSIAILNGWLMALSNKAIYGKPTVNLGTTFQAINGGILLNPFPDHSNYAFTGHQGSMYYCDLNAIGKLFPDTSLLTGVENVQSYCSYTAATTTGTLSAILSGSAPFDSSSAGSRIPAVFFTDEYGTQPTNLTAATVYYIAYSASTNRQFSVYSAITGGSAIDIAAGATGNQYFNTFYPLGGDAGPSGTHTTCVLTRARLNLPAFEVANTIAEIGNLVLIGCKGNVVYPWNQVDVLPAGLINLPEANVQNILTVNQVAYLFAGNQGNIYITDGSLASLALNLPDYLAGVPGSPGTYIESTYTWADSMYLRGRVYFSVLDQSSTKAGNCGGIWSFVPTQNLSGAEETGLALRLEAQNSYNTYNGAAALLIANAVQDAQQPLYWSAWYSSVSAPTYGIDYSTGGTNASFPAVIETDFIPIGTMLNKRTTNQLEYKLGAPLDTGATITAKYRTQLTDSWTSCDTFISDTAKLSGYARANYQQLQWVQFQFTLTPITSSATSNTFIRFREIRLR